MGFDLSIVTPEGEAYAGATEMRKDGTVAAY